MRDRTSMSTNLEKIMRVECKLWPGAAWKEKKIWIYFELSPTLTDDFMHSDTNIHRNPHPLESHNFSKNDHGH